MDAAALDSLLTVLRRHGVVQFCDGPVMVKLAPAVAPEAPKAVNTGPFSELTDALQRMNDLRGKANVGG